MTAAIALIIASVCLLYACLLWYLFQKKQEEERKYQLERLKVEVIITDYQIKELEYLSLLNDNNTKIIKGEKM